MARRTLCTTIALAMAAALRVGQDPAMAGKRLVVMLASYGERYLSTMLFDDCTDSRSSRRIFTS